MSSQVSCVFRHNLLFKLIRNHLWPGVVITLCVRHTRVKWIPLPRAHTLSHKHIIQVADKLWVKGTNPRLKSGTALSVKCLGVDAPAGGPKVVVSRWCVVAAGGQEQCLGAHCAFVCVEQKAPDGWNPATKKKKIEIEVLEVIQGEKEAWAPGSGGGSGPLKTHGHTPHAQI